MRDGWNFDQSLALGELRRLSGRAIRARSHGEAKGARRYDGLLARVQNRVIDQGRILPKRTQQTRKLET